MVICSHLYKPKQRLFTSSRRQIGRQTSPLRVSQSSTKTDRNPPEYGPYKNSKNHPECSQKDSKTIMTQEIKVDLPASHILALVSVTTAVQVKTMSRPTYFLSIKFGYKMLCSISRYFKINWLLSIFQPLIVLPIANILVSTGPGHFTCRRKFVNLENT